MKSCGLTAIVLTLNEARHLERCLENLRAVGASLLVVDSFSTDATLEIALKYGARILQHPFVHNADQFNWALQQVDEGTGWVLRLDADEYLTNELREEICLRLGDLPDSVDGVYCGRRMIFQGKMIRHGGLFPIRILRIFRNGRGRCENRWMDEHIKVEGETVDFAGEIIDDNLQPLTWWTDKHNRYASREAIDLLNLKYQFLPDDSIASLAGRSQAGTKRWIKERFYSRMPWGFRAFAYFCYRYFLRFGFLDGTAGTAFHVLQGFWYRYLVDAKIAEVERYITENRCNTVEAIENVLGISVTPHSKESGILR